MKMPASFAEFSDALQKARIKDGSFCKNELTCIHYNGLTHAMIGWNANLYDLNLFAQRLASLTEEQKKGMDALLKIKQNHRVAPIPLNQLINLTYNTDICCFAPRVSNHEELGAFLYANEMLSNEAMALLDTTEEGSGFQERLLELLGEQHQEDHGGVFTDFGYAELGGEIKDMPSILCLNDQGGSAIACSENVAGTLRAQEHGHQPLVFENHGIDARYTGPHSVAPTMSARYGTGGNNVPLVAEPDTIFCITGNAIDRQPMNGGNGIGYIERL